MNLFYIFNYIRLYCDFVLYLWGKAGVPCPQLCALMDPSYSRSDIFFLVEIPVQSKSFCSRMAKGVWWRARTSYGLMISWSAYLRRLSPAPPLHCRRWTLIFCAGTLDPRMQQCVACNKVMTTYSWRIPTFSSKVAATLLRATHCCIRGVQGAGAKN